MKGVPLFLVLLLAAGCLGQTSSRPDFGAVQSGLQKAAEPALDLAHADANGHYLAKLHNASYNMQLVGYTNGVDDSGDPNAIPAKGSYTELAVGNDGFAYLAATSPDGTFGGLSILDVSDPAHPKVVSRYASQSLFDVEVDAEGHYAYLATQRNSADQVAGGLQATQDPTANLPRGITVLDVSDKRHPTFVSFTPLPVNGPHTMTYVRHPDGDDYLLVCTYDLVTDPTTNAIAGVLPVTQRLLVYLVGHNPLGQSPKIGLVPVAQYQVLTSPSPPGPSQPLVFPHDTRVFQEAGGRVLIDLAYWDQGLRILDFTHPPSSTLPPTDQAQSPMLSEVGSYTNFYPSAFNNIHLAMTFPQPIAEKTITVTEPEIINADDETGQITILDTTDPSKPTMIGHWTLHDLAPDLGVSNLDFSPHNFDLWDGKIALAHYHAGVWVLDVRDQANLEHPQAVGFYMPHKERDQSPVEQPKVWGVVQSGGLLYVSDEATGLYVLRYTGP